MNDNKTNHVPLLSNACACLLTGVCFTALSEWDWIIHGHDFSNFKALVFPLISGLGMYGAHFFKMMGIKANMSREEKKLLQLHDKKIMELKSILSDPYVVENFNDAEKLEFKTRYINALLARTDIIDGKITFHKKQHEHFESEAEKQQKTSPLDNKELESEITKMSDSGKSTS